MFICSLKKQQWVCFIGFALLCFSNTAFAEGLGLLLHKVEQKSPLLNVVNAKADASSASIRMAESQYWGHAEVFGNTTHYSRVHLVNPTSYPPVLSRSQFDQNTYGFGAAYTLPVDIDGRISAKVNAQEHLSQAAHQSAEQTRLSLFSQTVSLYRGLQRLEGLRQAHLAHLKALQQHQKVTAMSVKVGRVAAVELLRIQSEIKSVEGLLVGLNGNEVRFRSALGALLNQRIFSDAIEHLDAVPAHPLSYNHHDKGLANRPDLKAAKSITWAENENIKGAKREWLPNLALRAETIRNQGYTANGQNNWNVGVQLSWQFWDGGRRSANSDRAEANREAAQQQYQTIFNQARAQLQSAKADWQAASQQYEAATSGLKSARETERIQSDRFNNGRISAVDFIDAEAALARSRADLTTSLANWWLADDQLYLAQGQTPSSYTSSGEQ